MRARIRAGDVDGAATMLPVERVYPVSGATAGRLGI
jgi:hypothetical protein